MSKEEQVLQLLQQYPNLSNREIGKMVGLTRQGIAHYTRKHGVHRDRCALQRLNNTNRNSTITISEKAKQILIGTLLGDSSISKYHRDCESVKILNSNITCGHSLAQKDYVLYLKSMLEREGLKSSYTETNKEHHTVIYGRKVTTFGRCDLRVVRNIQFNSWRDLWYPNGAKIVPKEIYDDFSALSLAIWYMDDGSKNNCSYYLHTEGFTLEDIEFLRNMLECKFSVFTEIHHNRGKNVIYIKAVSRELFTSLISPYVCDSMRYKIIKHNIGSE